MYKRQIYQIAESNRIETFFARIGMLYSAVCNVRASVYPILPQHAAAVGPAADRTYRSIVAAVSSSHAAPPHAAANAGRVSVVLTVELTRLY